MSRTLESLRMRAGLRRVDVAALVGTSESRVRDWELGITAPQIRNLIRLAYTLGVGVDEVAYALEETRAAAGNES